MSETKYFKDREKKGKLHPETEQGFLHSGEEVYSESQKFARLRKSVSTDSFSDKSEINISILAILRLKRAKSDELYNFEINEISSLVNQQTNYDTQSKCSENLQFGTNASNLYFNHMQ